MHELTITQNILDRSLEVVKERRSAKIKKIKLLIGEGTSFVPDCIRFYFDIIKKDTPAEPAVLEIETIPLKLSCPVCKKEFSSEKKEEPFCDCQKGLEIISGQELLIEYIEI